MSLLLGCLCTDNESAIELARVLSRSGVRVNQRNLQSLINQTRTNQTQANQPQTDQTQANQPQTDQARKNQALMNQTPGDQALKNQTPDGQTPSDQALKNQTPGNQTLGDQTQIDQNSLAIAPFEIIVLNPDDESSNGSELSLIDGVALAGKWMASHGARRCLLHYTSSSHHRLTNQLVPIADILNGLMPDTGSRLTVYCPANLTDPHTTDTKVPASKIKHPRDLPTQPAPNDLNALADALSRQLNQQPGIIERSTIKQGPLEILQSTDEFKAKDIHHLIMDAQNTDEFMNVVRATEQLSVLIGSSALAMHLPALFRIRGWLGTGDQIVPIA